jgi:hypothetical protein
MNCRQSLLVLSQYSSSLVLLPVEFSVKRLVLPVCTLYLIPQRLFEGIKFFAKLEKLVIKLCLHLTHLLFEDLVTALLNPSLIVLVMLFFLLQGYLLLDMLCQQVHLLLNFISLYICSSILRE